MAKISVARLMEYYDRLKATKLKPYAFALAGGCVRDALHERDIKDIDCFLQTEGTWAEDPNETCEQVEYVVKALNEYFHEKGYSKSEFVLVEGDKKSHKPSESADVAIHHVWSWDHGFSDIPFDLIFLDCYPQEHIQKGFDLGICQASIGYGGLRVTPAYRSDAFHKTITYLLGEDRKQGSMEHAKRVAEKYPGWRLRGF